MKVSLDYLMLLSHSLYFCSAAREKQKKSEKQNGFDRGLTAGEIIGAMENNGEVHFLIKW